MVTSDNGESTQNTEEVRMLEALYLMKLPLPECEHELCKNTAAWRVMWEEGACVCVPATVCDLGKSLIEEAMEYLDRTQCAVCGSWLVPAVLFPLYAKGRLL